jgi:amino acid adenylation domain-containing protein
MEQEYIQDLFTHTASRFNSNIAIDSSGFHLTYADLEARSNKLANFLLDNGVQPRSFVAVFASDSAEVITAIIAILKAGAVFVPLDPSFPDMRLQVMIEQVKPQWYVVGSKLLSKLSQVTLGAGSAVTAVSLNGEQAGIDGLTSLTLLKGLSTYDRTDRPSVPNDPDAACSIYFTSGSTGRPKAILGRLKGIDHYVRWQIDALSIKAGTRISQLASPSFDAFLKDTFVPLCAGGVVCAPKSRDLLLQPAQLIDWLDIEQIEVLQCVPSVFRSLLNEKLDSSYFEAMKYVVLAGEALMPADVKRWMEVFGERIRLVNLYGPTETTVLKLCHFVEAVDAQRPSIPIGKPISGAAVMVINSRGGLCRQGAVGEIYIRTPYRAIGYYGEPDLTKEAFIQNPFSDDPSDIVYKTGDFGRLLEDGNLEFLGRRDQQIKVRGVRVELGEIENLLREYEAVREVAVIDRDDSAGNKYLCAYLVLNDSSSTDQLREYLSERLPEAMMPSAFLQMQQLPRTLNGKIDRKSLPSVEMLQASSPVTEEAARTPVEEIVAGIWSQVLKLPRINRTDNFFNLGGHSLLVTQVISRVREALRVELPLRSVFEAPTVEQLAVVIQQQINQGNQSQMTEIRPVSREEELALSFSQQRMWLLEQLATGTTAFYIPLGVRLRGELNVAALEQTFGEIINRHEILRTTFHVLDERPVQIISPATDFHLPVVDLSNLSHDEREWWARELAQEETIRRFHLSKGPLVRIRLLKLSPLEHIVICTMHHIVGDGWSLDVITNEMSQLYRAFCEGQPSPLADLKVQYVDYAAWQRQWLEGDELERRQAYWRHQLEDAPTHLRLPQRRQRPKVQSFHFQGARQSMKLSKEMTEALRELSRREGMTLFMTMLSGFVLLLNQYTGDEDIVVGTVIANRERAEVEGMIGFLANTLVMRVDMSAETSFRDVMRRVREVCFGAYANQLPPEKLIEELNRLGGDNRQRLFDVWFQVDREKMENLEMKGLEYEWYLEGKEDARFELSMVLGERDGEMSGDLEYDKAFFDNDTIAQMLDSYVTLLKEMTADPNQAF